MESRGGASDRLWRSTDATHATHPQPGRKDMQMWWIFPQHLVMPGLNTTEKSTKSAKELIQVIKHPGPKNPFTIREIQLPTIDRLAKLFNTIQPEKTQTKLVPREVPMIGPPRVPITLPSLRVPATVTPPRVMTPRVPMISQEGTIEESRQRDTV